MAKPKPNLLSGIDLPEEDLAEYKGHVETVQRHIRENAPALKKGFKEIETDVLKTGKALFDWLASQDLEKE